MYGLPLKAAQCPYLQPELVVADREVPVEEEHPFNSPLPHAAHCFPVFLLAVTHPINGGDGGQKMQTLIRLNTLAASWPGEGTGIMVRRNSVRSCEL